MYALAALFGSRSSLFDGQSHVEVVSLPLFLQEMVEMYPQGHSRQLADAAACFKLQMGCLVLSYAVAAFVMALLSVLLDQTASLLSESMVFLLIGTVLLLPARWLVKRNNAQVPDINQY
jgi:hypothetical protein